jgi:phospholipid/cholesterol/gamma-HCH transport system substrate-binding protein
MEIDLQPGAAPAAALPDGGTIDPARTMSPVNVSDVLAGLDTDTRGYLTSLINSLGEGTQGRASDMRRVLAALGPTTAQVGQISKTLAQRREELAHLVHNLALVTHAASRDDRLGSVIAAGNQTLETIAGQDRALRQTLDELPPTLNVTRSTLTHLEPFAHKLAPTVHALLPAVRRLPLTLRTLRPFAGEARAALKRQIRPLVRGAVPLAGTLSPTVASLTSETPLLSRSFQVLEYLVNELAYNPPGNDEGFLLWIPWFVHNFNSVVSSGDANGALGRAIALVDCYGLQSMPNLQSALGVVGACPP